MPCVHSSYSLDQRPLWAMNPTLNWDKIFNVKTVGQTLKKTIISPTGVDGFIIIMGGIPAAKTEHQFNMRERTEKI